MYELIALVAAGIALIGLGVLTRRVQRLEKELTDILG